VPNRDFFAFSTTLKPLELKAIGTLSEVRHVAAGETIYQAGDLSATLYIINRGVIEIVQEGLPRAAAAAYLTRGDIFGDVEVLTGLPRKHLVRTREPASLQCFDRKDFPELLKRVPSFFHYLSEQLATRLLHARDAVLAQSHCLELSGSLTNFDLVTIYQTIVNSSQTGELSILNEQGELVCAFIFETGQPRGGQFQHLTGEEAFWQLFLADDLRGTFSFASGARTISHSIQTGSITREPNEILITALQWRDELAALRNELPDGPVILKRQKSDLALTDITPERLRPVAEGIWRLAPAKPMPLDELYAKSSVCELTVYQAAQELVRTGHCVWSTSGLSEKVA